MAGSGEVAQAGQVSGSAAVPPAPRPGPAWRLPSGRDLTPADYDWRHRVVCAVVLAHVPALVLLGALGDGGVSAGVLVAAAVAVLLGVAAPPTLPRRLRTLAASTALLTCSAGLVTLTGALGAHLHCFAAVALIALYQDWLGYAVAVPYVAVMHAVDPATDLTFAAVHLATLLAEAAVLIVFWHANESARIEQERLRNALLTTQIDVRARLEETDQIRTDLIGTVSHEFRTPLTGIRAAALTLLKRGERLDPAGRARLLHAVLDQQERLSRLLENMLTAARATATDPSAASEVDVVAAEVAMLAGATRPESPRVSVLVEQGTVARIDRQALHQVLANLVDNAQQHGAPGAVPLVAAGRDDRGVWLTVSNEGTTLTSEQARTLFEPFTQVQSGVTREREGLGMGLYVVRKLVEVYGGSVQIESEDGWTTVELVLRDADEAVDGERTRAVQPSLR
ncbi:MAG: HAMP domain-containing histidine kinase [Actinomycetota bacterium]|nr:HAMP domain-containing histidine kinase [Actinomycetota bacterium]